MPPTGANHQPSARPEARFTPVFHRLPERIRAHASICFMALILYRVMRQRVSIHRGAPISGISNINRNQTELLSAMNLRKPAPDTQMSLL